MPRVWAGTGVERIAVEDEVRDAVEERGELRESGDARGAIAVMDVGEDAGEDGGHA